VRVLISKKVLTGTLLFAFALFALPGAASAEGGLFGAILNALGRAIAPPHHSAPPPAEVPGNPLSYIFAPGSEITPAEGGPQVAFCVRTCDGRYFPMAKNGSVTPGKMCQSMCPAAQTEIYSGSNIENAVSQKGARYSSLANAYLYREKMVDGCSCNSKRELGMASVSYMNDPTLRPGDIVMTENGPVVFKGAVGPAHQMSDFVPVKDSKQLSGRTKEKVIAMRAMPSRQAQIQHATTAKEAAATLAKTSDAKGRALGFAD
jgi:hypothetical protein